MYFTLLLISFVSKKTLNATSGPTRPINIRIIIVTFPIKFNILESIIPNPVLEYEPTQWKIMFSNPTSLKNDIFIVPTNTTNKLNYVIVIAFIIVFSGIRL